MRKQYPRADERRIVSRFLWLPLTLRNSDGVLECRWLEFARWQEKWVDESFWYPSSGWL